GPTRWPKSPPAASGPMPPRAYDLVLAFQFLCLPPDKQHWNISTLRRDLWWLPAEWVNRHNRNYLRLPQRYPEQDLFFKIQSAASRVKPLV
ncbi:MAG: hypothetical protein ACE5JN_04955, partial [Candidatus Methylomirabilia bacterium]